jgi:hypothetical protein
MVSENSKEMHYHIWADPLTSVQETNNVLGVLGVFARGLQFKVTVILEV